MRRGVSRQISTETHDEDQLVRDLRGAVARGEIVAHYQPQLDVATDRVVAVESLSRWMHPGLGMQSPTVFIPLAEEFGLIDEVGSYMVTAALNFASELERRALELDVSVNVSAMQLAHRAFFDDLEEALDELDLRPDALTLEITESRFIANRPSVAARLRRLRDRGVGISIDDFGVGHSSVEQVLALPANELKIDRTVVQDETATQGILLATIVRLVKERGLRTVAEGVETEAQLDRVRELGCDRAQGYLIGWPMPQDEMIESLGLERA
jgi:EAL domain-containing protein (putative c-di-GMP-specific phosphodiesterase class I)